MSRPVALLLTTEYLMAILSWLPCQAAELQNQREILEPAFLHLRNGNDREWSSFPMEASDHLEVRFSSAGNASEFAIRVRQQDVKQAWRVLLNGKSLGELVRDENDQILYLPVPAGALRDGENVLRLGSLSRTSDDIRAGEIWLEQRPRLGALSESAIDVQVTEADRAELTPARITVTNSSGSLQAFGIESNERLAVRSGVVYTSDGHAQIKLPAGQYTIYAGRGFEYSLARIEVTVGPGEAVARTLVIRREVSTPGYVACDTHIHTLTYSRHGDASLAERMITLAGEGIELPIATDHNVHVDYQKEAEKLGVRRYFTPVVGNEVTTSLGHFNVFPTKANERIPDFKQTSWKAIFNEILGTPCVKVAVLNHARDVHGATRPFGPKLFNTAIGDNVENWPMRFNAMEIINSGATQTDPLRLVRDWMALLNRGYRVTPIGSSDSHDVSRYIVGQGRTYIRGDDRDPANIDVDAAVDNLLAGRVLVSYGLLLEAFVNDKYRAGDFAPLTDDEIVVQLRLLVPSWSRATRIQLYANGTLLKTVELAGDSTAQHVVKISRPAHDTHLVAVALGPGIASPAWPTAKPYQPSSPDWQPYVIGICGPIWLDGDGDGLRSTARDYAERIVANCRGDSTKVADSLRSFDDAVSAQAAHILRLSGQPLDSFERFRPYLDAWRENERARVGP